MPTSLRQEFVRIRAAHENTREAVLLALLSRTFTKHVIVFAREKRTAHRLRLLIGLAGLSCCELHGNLSQEQRMQSLEDFKEGRTDILVATDIASRGIDVPCVDTVVNFEAPKTLSECAARARFPQRFFVTFCGKVHSSRGTHGQGGAQGLRLHNRRRWSQDS